EMKKKPVILRLELSNPQQDLGECCLFSVDNRNDNSRHYFLSNGRCPFRRSFAMPMYNPMIAPMTMPRGPVKKIRKSGPWGEFAVRRMGPANPSKNSAAPTDIAVPIHQRVILGRSTSKSPRKLPQASPAAMPRTRPNSEGHLGPSYPPADETIAPSS